MYLNKIIGLTIALSIYSFGLEVCSSQNEMNICNTINNNRTIIKNGIHSKKQLTAVAQISRYVGLLSPNDNRELKGILKQIPTFKSAITGKNTIMVLASPCGSKKYIVEIGFDRNYQLSFFERKYNLLKKYGGALYLDREKFPIADKNLIIYSQALQSVISRKEIIQTYSQVQAPIIKRVEPQQNYTQTNYKCVRTNSSPLMFRDINHPETVLSPLQPNTQIEIINQNIEIINKQESYIARFQGNIGFVAKRYIGECK